MCVSIEAALSATQCQATGNKAPRVESKRRDDEMNE